MTRHQIRAEFAQGAGGGSRASRARLAAAALLAAAVLGPDLALASGPPIINAATMAVNGVVGERHLITPTPGFSWIFPGPGTQTNWQIQVDNDPNFQGEIWFWDSGSGTKGGLESATSVSFAAVTAPGKFSRPVDTRADLVYWRLRVQVNNDPNWTSDASNYSYGSFKLNQIPLGADVVATADPTPGGIPSASGYPALPSAPKEFFVATTGSDSNPGTLSQPFRTIQRGAQALSPGDTLSIRQGTYTENVRILPNTGGIKNGNPGGPITLRARPGESVIVRGVTGAQYPSAPFAFIGSGGPVRNWTLRGVKLGGTAVQVGAYVANGENITLEQLTFEPTFNPAGTGVKLEGGGEGCRVLDSKFNTKMFDQVEVAGSRHVEVRGNEFTAGNSHVAIHWHNSRGEGGVVQDNVFHDFSASEGALFVYLSGDGMIVRNNLFYNVTEPSGGYSAAIVIMRCGKIRIENNTFVRNRRGIGFNEFSRYNIIRNNIFVENTVAFDFRPTQSAAPGSTALGTVFSHNFTFNNGLDFDVFHPSDNALFTQTSNCYGGDAPSTNLLCDPKFVNLAGNDFHLQSASPCRDAGDPNSPVPVGGASVVDVGALEFGAAPAPPYDWQPVTTIGDMTPRFTWNFIDRDNDLHAFDPTIVPDTDSQFAYEIQVDTRNRFDSVGGNRPLFSSGTIPSSVQGYTLPDANALPAGEYYVRVRQRDENQGLLGGWSDNNLRIRIASEPQAPVVTQQIPAAGALGVDPNTSVHFHVSDFGAGVNSATILVTYGVNDPSAPDSATGLQLTQTGSTPADFAVSFQPSPAPLPSGSVVTVRVRASDLYVPANAVDTSYSFTIRDTTPPAAPSDLRFVP